MDKPLIMVVEDEVEYAREIAGDVESSGKYTAIIANSAKEALDSISKNKILFGLGGNRIQLILLDIKMPEMDGLQFLEKLRKSYKDDQIGVIMITAFEDEEKWDKATSGFVIGYLKKPYDRANLLSIIDKFFSSDEAKYRMTLDTFEQHVEKREEFRKKPESAG